MIPDLKTGALEQLHSHLRQWRAEVSREWTKVYEPDTSEYAELRHWRDNILQLLIADLELYGG